MDIEANFFHAQLDKKLRKLSRAIEKGRSRKTCHRYWSEFVRCRDKGQCVVCESSYRIQGHHIFRKSLVSRARFDTGNGATLCFQCHKKAHEGFNGRPNLDLPMDQEGGEKIDYSIVVMAALLRTAKNNGLLGDKYYYLSDNTLGVLKKMQSFALHQPLPGCRLEQAWLVWSDTADSVRSALLMANGIVELSVEEKYSMYEQRLQEALFMDPLQAPPPNLYAFF
ncbi:MAG: HNH endonuclease [Halopseudomonas aestusnigri]